MVRESKALLPSTEIERPVRPLAIGPWKLKLNRCCSVGSLTAEKAFRAFSDSSRKPRFIRPRHPPMPGFVITSTRTMPASWYPAENELLLKRMLWI